MKPHLKPMLLQIQEEWDRRGWDRSFLGTLRMEEGGGAGGDGGAEGGNPPAPAPKTFTQEEVSAMLTREKDQGKRAAEEAIAKQLGVSIEDAKKLIADAKKREDAEKSEAQKAREAADAEKAEAERNKSEAARERHATRVERALLRALPKDLDDDKLDARVSKLTRLIDVEVGADDAAIKAAVEELRKEWPELFPTNGSGNGGKNPPPPGDPKGKPPTPKVGNDAYNKGLERAKARTGTGTYDMLKSLTPGD